MKRIIRSLFAFCVFCQSVNGEVTDISAIPQAKGEILVGNQIQYVRVLNDASELGVGVFEGEQILIQSGVTYGLTERLTFGVLVPIISKTGEQTVSAEDTGSIPIRFSTNKTGLGDVQAGIRYTLYQWDRPAKTFRLAPFAGLKFPTGDSDDKGLPDPEDSTFPPFAQLGSGSWDPFLGAAWIYQTLKWHVDGAIRYTFRTEGTLAEFGDEFSVNAGFMHVVWPCEVREEGNFYAGLETTFLWQGEDTLFFDGESFELPFTGASRWFLSPVIQYRRSGVKVSGFVSFPVLQDLNEGEIEPGIVAENPFKVDFVAGAVVILSF